MPDPPSIDGEGRRALLAKSLKLENELGQAGGRRARSAGDDRDVGDGSRLSVEGERADRRAFGGAKGRSERLALAVERCDFRVRGPLARDKAGRGVVTQNGAGGRVFDEPAAADVQERPQSTSTGGDQIQPPVRVDID